MITCKNIILTIKQIVLNKYTIKIMKATFNIIVHTIQSTHFIHQHLHQTRKEIR